MEPGLQLKRAQKGQDLSVEGLGLNRRLRTTVVEFAAGAVVIEVAKGAFALVLGGDGAAASAASDQPPIGDRECRRDRGGTALRRLQPIEGRGIHRRRVFAGPGPAIPDDDPGVEGIGEDAVGRTVRQGYAGLAVRGRGDEPPITAGDAGRLVDAASPVGDQPEQTLNQREIHRVGDDGAGGAVVTVAERGAIGPPAVLQLGAVAAFDVFGQGVGIVFGLAEHDLQHELALRIVLEGVGGEFQVLEHAAIQQIDQPPAVDGVARQTVRSPGGDALRLALFDAGDHSVEAGPPRRHGALGLLDDLDDLGSRRSGQQPLQFATLGFDRQHLTILGFRGFPAVEKIFHRERDVPDVPDLPERGS